MRVVHLANNYGLNNTGGAAIAATRIHQILLKAGVDSHYVCVNKFEDGENVYEIPPSGTIIRRVRNGLRFLEHVVGRIVCGKGRSNGIDIVPLFGLERILAEIKPDIVHVHRTNAEVAPFQQLAKLSYHVIFHLHDLWMVNGLQPCPGKDRRYVEGFSRANSCFLERMLFNQKRKTVAKLKPRFVGPSKWICRSCEESLVASGCTVTHVPYVFDERFDYRPELRKRTEKFVVLFGCFRGTQNPLKGWEDLMAAVRLLPAEAREQIEIHIFGEDSPSRVENGVKLVFHGSITQTDRIMGLYHVANVFSLPSKEDNSPLTKFEALFCGVPVLTFDRRGCPEEIEHGVTGWIAPDGDSAAYAAGILHFLEQWKRNAIDYAGISASFHARFATVDIVNRMMAVYREVVA